MVLFLKILLVVIFIVFFLSYIECFFFGADIWEKFNPFKNKSEYKQNQHKIVCVNLIENGKFCVENKSIKDFPVITFNQFLDFYYLNPSSWSLRECRVCKNNDNNLSFTFTYEDWKKYKKWRKQLKKDTESKRINDYKHDVTKKILEAVQVDIENIRAESKKDLEMAQELMKEVNLK